MEIRYLQLELFLGRDGRLRTLAGVLVAALRDEVNGRGQAVDGQLVAGPEFVVAFGQSPCRRRTDYINTLVRFPSKLQRSSHREEEWCWLRRWWPGPARGRRTPAPPPPPSARPRSPCGPQRPAPCPKTRLFCCGADPPSSGSRSSIWAGLSSEARCVLPFQTTNIWRSIFKEILSFLENWSWKVSDLLQITKNGHFPEFKS